MWDQCHWSYTFRYPGSQIVTVLQHISLWVSRRVSVWVMPHLGSWQWPSLYTILSASIHLLNQSSCLYPPVNKLVSQPLICWLSLVLTDSHKGRLTTQSAEWWRWNQCHCVTDFSTALRKRWLIISSWSKTRCIVRTSLMFFSHCLFVLDVTDSTGDDCEWCGLRSWRSKWYGIACCQADLQLRSCSGIEVFCLDLLGLS